MDEHELMTKAETDFKKAMDGLNDLSKSLERDMKRIAHKAFNAGFILGLLAGLLVAFLWGIMQ